MPFSDSYRYRSGTTNTPSDWSQAGRVNKKLETVILSEAEVQKLETG